MHDLPLYDILMIILFVLGYFFITIEHLTHVSKTSIALLMGILCWVLQFAKGNGFDSNEIHLQHLGEHLASISQVIFFLLGALTIVEIINAHDGFRILTNSIHPRSKKSLLWIMGFIGFFLSAVLDNLTTTIILVTLLTKLIPATKERLLYGGAVVIAANAGGAWTPIGDVTTTMLWIGGQVTTLSVMRDLFIPSIVCMIVALSVISLFLKGSFTEITKTSNVLPPTKIGNAIFCLGISCLIFVPVFKLATGLPPFMGIILGLSVMWLITDLIHGNQKSKEHLKVPSVMSNVDFASVLFFLGILLAVEALYSAGLLTQLAHWMDITIANPSLIAIIIGLASSILDNVPLVAATMGMYDLTQYPPDSVFWDLISYCAGTGGSILVIGSAAGVAFMGLEKVEFFWYLRKVGIPALIGYLAGVGAFFLIK